MSKMKEYAALLNAEQGNGDFSDAPFDLGGTPTHTFDAQNTQVAIPADMNTLLAQFQAAVKAPTPKNNRVELITDPESGKKVFEFPDETKVESFRCVVVNFVYANNYYDSQYIQGEFNPPVCFALGKDQDALTHSTKAKQPQYANCKDCPMNQFGTRGRGKACSNRMYVAVLPLDADQSTQIHVLDIAPTGIKAFKDYFLQLARPVNAGGLGLPPQGIDVLVRPAPVTYPLIQFTDGKPLDFNSPFVRTVLSRIQEAEELLLNEPDYDEIVANIEAKSGFKPVRKSRM